MKILLTLFAVSLSSCLFAQTIEEIRDMAGKNQWVKARKGIDDYLTNDVNARKGDGWYLKAVIYNSMAKDTSFGTQANNLRMDAFNSYKRYLELDKDAAEGRQSQHAPLFDMAFGYLNRASESFNTHKYDDALISFRGAESVEDYIVKRGFRYDNFTFQPYDTQLYLNIAAAAVNAKKEDVALEYYQKIADKRITKPGYENIYRYIVDRYRERGDKEKKSKYLAIGREAYPKDPYWNDLDLKEAGDDKKKLFAKYSELIARNPNDYNLHYNYVVEMFNYAFVQGKRPDDFAQIDARLPIVAKKTIAINSTAEANMLMCRYQFAHINDLLASYNAITGTKPDDLRKKDNFNSLVNRKYEEVLPYAQTVYDMFAGKTDLKGSDKDNYKLAANMLMEYWERKNDKAKVAIYQEKVKELQ